MNPFIWASPHAAASIYCTIPGVEISVGGPWWGGGEECCQFCWSGYVATIYCVLSISYNASVHELHLVDAIFEVVLVLQSWVHVTGAGSPYIWDNSSLFMGIVRHLLTDDT